jgi:hypothetical protein
MNSTVPGGSIDRAPIRTEDPNSVREGGHADPDGTDRPHGAKELDSPVDPRRTGKDRADHAVAVEVRPGPHQQDGVAPGPDTRNQIRREIRRNRHGPETSG